MAMVRSGLAFVGALLVATPLAYGYFAGGGKDAARGDDCLIGWSSERLAARPAHRAVLARLHHEGLLVAAGPWADDMGADAHDRCSSQQCASRHDNRDQRLDERGGRTPHVCWRAMLRDAVRFNRAHVRSARSPVRPRSPALTKST